MFTSRPSRKTRIINFQTGSAVTPIKPKITEQERNKMIAMRAYLKAEKRGFKGGDSHQDWIESEREVALLLSNEKSSY